MNVDEYEKQLRVVREIQRTAGWSERSVMLYIADLRACVEAMGGPNAVLCVGAGLAQDNSRFGVYYEQR